MSRVEELGHDRHRIGSPALCPFYPEAARTRVAPSDHARFDPLTYEHGLRPERWRVPVIGAFKRGKSSLINAIAGSRVLPDEGADVEMHFPVHVRYGERHRAYALGDDAGWNEIALSEALDVTATSSHQTFTSHLPLSTLIVTWRGHNDNRRDDHRSDVNGRDER